MKTHRLLVEIGNMSISYIKHDRLNYFFLLEKHKVMSGLTLDFNELIKKACILQGILKYHD